MVNRIVNRAARWQSQKKRRRVAPLQISIAINDGRAAAVV